MRLSPKELESLSIRLMMEFNQPRSLATQRENFFVVKKTVKIARNQNKKTLMQPQLLEFNESSVEIKYAITK